MTETRIGFEIPDPAEVRLIIHDPSGKVVFDNAQPFEAGYQEWKVKRNGLPYGLLYYTIQTDQYRATKKMILVE